MQAKMKKLSILKCCNCRGKNVLDPFLFCPFSPCPVFTTECNTLSRILFSLPFFCSHLRSLPRRGGEELKKKNIPAMESNIILKMDAFIALINNETWIRCNRYSGLFICRSVCASLSVYFLSTQVEIPPRRSIIRFFGR